MDNKTFNGVKGLVNHNNPLIPSYMDDFFNGLAKHMGVKRYSPEYNRLLWVNLLGVSPEVYDAIENRK